jgi:hypothetical protein
MWLFWSILVPVLFGAALAMLVAVGIRRRRVQEIRCAVKLFRQRRELLEAKFVDLAGRIGKPRGLRWLDCDWLESTTFARDKSTGLITAFASINVRFEAVEGGDMEDVAAVGTVRDAVALFHYQRGNWGTGGRALFNMNPDDAVSRLVDQYERLPVELT